MPRPSIKDVAERARVSVATVSRAINAPGAVKPETAERVKKAIAQLGFRPNLVGRNLRSGSTRTVGVVLPTFSNAVFAECLEGIERAARERDYAVVLTATDYQAADEDDACERLLGHRVDGLILTVANAAKSALLDRLERERVATVLVYNQVTPRSRLTVAVDNRAAAREAVEHLIALGHRRIAMVAGALAASDRAAERHRGYGDALRAAGLPARPAVELPRHTEGSLAALRALFGGREAPTALFCSNDLLAIGVMRDLRALALRVPDDVSVVPFDGIAFGQFVEPALTTVEQPSREMGARAMELLAARLEGRRGLAPIQLPHRLRTGHSTRAVEAATQPARRKR